MIFPSEFRERTQQLLGNDYAMLEEALQKEPPVSIRLNRSKPFAANTIDGKEVPWCQSGYYLPERPSFTFDPLFHAGTYYVQEAASMFIEQAVRQHLSSPVVALDLCAAPGGKSTHLLDLLPSGSLLVSNEVIRSRCKILTENIIKWGAPHCAVTNNDPKDFGSLTHLFDWIITDMPCSGEGMFRKDPASRTAWSLSNVRLCAARQRRIIHDVWDALKPGGLLIYSTCTFNTEENEENIRYITDTFGAEAIRLEISETWGICGAFHDTLPVYRFFPHRTKGEGFCMAVLRKPDETTRTVTRKNKSKHIEQSFPMQAKKWLTIPEAYRFEKNDSLIRALPAAHQDTLQLLSEHLHVVSAGIPLGETKGKDLLPSAALALSTVLRPEAFPHFDMSHQEAIRYLQNETLTLPSDAPRGFVLVTYRNIPLGFVKNLGTRANNLYPKAWKIRKRTVSPDETLFGDTDKYLSAPSL